MSSERIRLRDESQARVDQYLGAIDRVLAAAGMPYSERRNIAEDVEGQIFDMLLAGGIADPGVPDVDAVIMKLDPPEAYAQAAGDPEAERREAPAVVPPAPPSPPPRPRLSRAAVVGAIWAPMVLGLVAALIVPSIASRESAREEAVRQEVAQLQAVREEAARAEMGKVRPPPQETLPPPGQPSQAAVETSTALKRVTWAGILLLVPLALAGLTAPFGTTILGIVAIVQIRRSAGRLYGLGLALFDALIFPLGFVNLLMLALVGFLASRQGETAVAPVVVALATVAALDVGTFWLLCRALRPPRAKTPEASDGGPPSASKDVPASAKTLRLK